MSVRITLIIRALKLVYNDKDCSYYELLLKANVPSVLIKRQRILATEVFKALQDISPPYIQDLFKEKDVPYNLRASKIVIQPKCQSTTHGLNSLTYQGAKCWNSLPEQIKGAETVGQFQSYINTHLLQIVFMSFICKYGFNCTGIILCHRNVYVFYMKIRF